MLDPATVTACLSPSCCWPAVLLLPAELVAEDATVLDRNVVLESLGGVTELQVVGAIFFMCREKKGSTTHGHEANNQDDQCFVSHAGLVPRFQTLPSRFVGKDLLGKSLQPTIQLRSLFFFFFFFWSSFQSKHLFTA